MSGIFTTQLPENVEDETVEEQHYVEEPLITNVDNEDDLLYGDAPAFQMPMPSQMKVTEGGGKKSFWYRFSSNKSYLNNHRTNHSF